MSRFRNYHSKLILRWINLDLRLPILSGVVAVCQPQNISRHERVRLQCGTTGRPDSATAGYCLVGVRTAAIGLVNLVGKAADQIDFI